MITIKQNMVPRSFLWAVSLILMISCQDLSVENENNPAGGQGLLDPVFLEAMGADLFAQNWERQWCGEAMMMQTMADANSSAWPNWGMRDMSSEPRVAWNNDPAYNWKASVERPWFGSYRAISNANDVLRGIAIADEKGLFVSSGVDVHRLQAFAIFNQAWAYAYLALIFDKAFIVDETTDLEAVARGDVILKLSPYAEVMEAALMQMDEAIALETDALAAKNILFHPAEPIQ